MEENSPQIGCASRACGYRCSLCRLLKIKMSEFMHFPLLFLLCYKVEETVEQQRRAQPSKLFLVICRWNICHNSISVTFNTFWVIKDPLLKHWSTIRLSNPFTWVSGFLCANIFWNDSSTKHTGPETKVEEAVTVCRSAANWAAQSAPHWAVEQSRCGNNRLLPRLTLAQSANLQQQQVG